jgi:hypothetical protein
MEDLDLDFIVSLQVVRTEIDLESGRAYFIGRPYAVHINFIGAKAYSVLPERILNVNVLVLVFAFNDKHRSGICRR